jgi:tripartite-type tricarboxylate transporter receptor subunit TctC
MHPTPTRRSALQFGSAAAAVAAFPTLLGNAHGQSPWPSKPIRLLVPFAPGGSSEIVARSAAAEISKSLGQNVFVENKPGASGNIAMQECAASTDGHTMILGHIGTPAVNPFIFDKLPFDTNRDFRPISLLAKVPSLYVVNADVPAKNLKEFIALAKARPGQLNYGSAGNGSAGHLILGHIKSGKLRCIATGTKERLPQLPDVPTVAESGYPGFEMTQWYGLNAPPSMPQAAIDRIAEACARAMRNPLATERLRGDTAQPVGDTPAQYAAFIKSEQERWKLVVARARIKPD